MIKPFFLEQTHYGLGYANFVSKWGHRMKAEKSTEQCILEPSKKPLDNSILKTKEKGKKSH